MDRIAVHSRARVVGTDRLLRHGFAFGRILRGAGTRSQKSTTVAVAVAACRKPAKRICTNIRKQERVCRPIESQKTRTDRRMPATGSRHGHNMILLITITTASIPIVIVIMVIAAAAAVFVRQNGPRRIRHGAAKRDGDRLGP